MNTTIDAKPHAKPTLFIGSSSEALRVVNRLVGPLAAHFEVRPWNQVFSPGEYTLDVLLAEVERAQTAIFVFAKDDEVKIRGESGYSARGNVLLEYGIFISRRGRQRVLILEEAGVGLPSDVFGVTTKRFPSGTGPDVDAALSLFVDEVVVPRWASLAAPTPGDAIADSGLGFTRTLQSERDKLSDLVSTLASYAHDDHVRMGKPISFGSTAAPISTYAEALGKVQRRFWTTTFLSSGFWTRPEGRILDANEKMLSRVARGGARRLFLLDQPRQMVVQAYSDHRILQRKLHKAEDLQRLNDEHEHLKQNMASLLDQGFEVRAAYDENKLYHSLPEGMLSDPMDSEVAIYDDFRVDVFDGGLRGVIHGVKSYTPLYRYFPAYLKLTERYFEGLWKKAFPMSEFMEELQEAVDLTRAKIDYSSNWLAMYEYALGEEDEKLKTVELSRVEEVLRERLGLRAGTIRRYLDVGTGTGRYPINLRSALGPDARIAGIDQDFDCVRFAQANVRRHCPDDARIEITRCNFLAREVNIHPPFDLITCMLGTLSHFGWDRTETYDDCLQRALKRMAELLSDEGILFLGTWSEYARQNRDMLQIYTHSDLDRLVDWTPSLDELDDRLAQAGLQKIERAQPQLRLDLTWCRRAP